MKLYAGQKFKYFPNSSRVVFKENRLAALGRSIELWLVELARIKKKQHAPRTAENQKSRKANRHRSPVKQKVLIF